MANVNVRPPYLAFPRGRVRILDRREFVVHIEPLERDRRQQLVAAQRQRVRRHGQHQCQLKLVHTRHLGGVGSGVGVLVAGRRGRFDGGRFGHQALVEGGALCAALLRRVLARVRVVDCGIV
jgi:hypothetical protein